MVEHGTPPIQPGSGPPAKKRPLAETKPPRQWSRRRSARAPRPAQVAPPEPAKPVAESAPDQPVAASKPQAEPVAQERPERFELQTHYGQDRFVLLVRDPRWAYAWWEVTDRTFETARTGLGEDTALVLRVLPLEGAEGEPYDLSIQDRVGSWYLELGQPGGRFRAEIGLRTASGSFRSLVGSNEITLPSDRMSHVTDEEWMVSEEAYRRLYGTARFGSGSDQLLRILEHRLRSELASGGISSLGAMRGESSRGTT